MLDAKSNAHANVSQDVRLPDFFGCQNCIAWKEGARVQPEHPLADEGGQVVVCDKLRQEGACAKLMLARALATGAVQVHLHLEAPAPALLPGKAM